MKRKKTIIHSHTHMRGFLRKKKEQHVSGFKFEDDNEFRIKSQMSFLK